jgi:hypothetical protein
MEIRTNYPPEITIKKRLGIVSATESLYKIDNYGLSQLDPKDAVQQVTKLIIKEAEALGATAIIGVSFQPIAAGAKGERPMIFVVGEAVVLRD